MNITLVLCTRNRWEGMLRNLALYVEQFQEGDEVIIVDSSDEIHEFSQENFVQTQAKIYYYHTLPGLPMQRNYGIDRASGALIMFLDDDIYLYPDALKSVRSFFEAHRDVDAVTGALSEKLLPSRLMRALQYVFGKLFFTSYFGKMGLTPGGLPIIALDTENKHEAKFLRGGFSVYRSTVFERVRYDEHFKNYAYLEDTDFSMQFNRCFRACFLDTFRGFHAHESTVNRDQSSYRKQYVLNYVYIYRKFHLGSDFKMHRVLLGLLLLNGVKSLLTWNGSFYRGTLQGLKEIKEK